MRGFSLFDLVIALVLLVAAGIGPLLSGYSTHMTIVERPGERPSTTAAEEIGSTGAAKAQADEKNERTIYTRFDQAAQRSEIWSIGLADSTDKMIAACPKGCEISDIATSPDDQRIAYITATSGQPGELHLIGSNGQGQRLLARNAALLGSHAFSPDGTRIAFVRYRYAGDVPQAGSIWVADTRSGRAHQVSPWHSLTSVPAWLSNHELVYSAAAAPGAEAAVYRTQGGSEPQLLHQGWLLDIAPDRNHLLVLFGSHTASPEQERFEHAVIALSGSEPQLVAQWQWPLGLTSWSPDGTRIALLSGETHSLLVADLSNGEQRLVKQFELTSELSSQPAWAADGKSIIYALGAGEAGGVAQLRRLKLASGREQQLTAFSGRAPLVAAAARH